MIPAESRMVLAVSGSASHAALKASHMTAREEVQTEHARQDVQHACTVLHCTLVIPARWHGPAAPQMAAAHMAVGLVTSVAPVMRLSEPELIFHRLQKAR
jgi:hypothetical protein